MTSGCSSSTEVDHVLWDGRRSLPRSEALPEEEPLEIRVNGAPIAVLMRTPGEDEDLVRGFLITTRVIRNIDEILLLRRYPAGPERQGPAMVAVLDPRASFDLKHLPRHAYSACCGVCEAANNESGLHAPLPLTDEPEAALAPRTRKVPNLEELRLKLGRSRGLYSAGAFSADGELLAFHQDIGRHNVVDKIVGALAASSAKADMLVVSGRVSCEIIQKALAARIPAIASEEAPSTLAVSMARASNMTVVSPLTGSGRLAVYADSGRILNPSDPFLVVDAERSQGPPMVS